MNRLIIWMVKFIKKIMSFSGGGSSFPGKLALQINPHILKELSWPEDIIYVTGTNGKTSTTHYIAQMFARDGREVLTNQEGANLLQGITTEALLAADYSGNIQASIAVFEVDEGTIAPLSKIVPPSHLVMTNLFADQLDRFESPEKLMAHLAEVISPKTSLILNGNDPRLVEIARRNPNLTTFFYGIEVDDYQQSTREIPCPNCGNKFTLLDLSYEHIGEFECHCCHLSTPKIDFLAEDVHLPSQTFKVDGHSFKIPQENIYSLFNACAAVATGKVLGTRIEAISGMLKGPLHVKGRNDQIEIGHHQAPISLAKNPASMNQTMTTMLNKIEAPFNLWIALNNAPADGTDLSWVYDVDFDILPKKYLNKVFISGSAPDIVKDALMRINLPIEKLEIMSHQEVLDSLDEQSEAPYIIANYTALYEIYDLV